MNQQLWLKAFQLCLFVHCAFLVWCLLHASPFASAVENSLFHMFLVFTTIAGMVVHWQLFLPKEVINSMIDKNRWLPALLLLTLFCPYLTAVYFGFEYNRWQLRPSNKTE